MTSRLSVESFGLYSLCMTIVLFSRQIIYDPISTVVVKNVAAMFHREEAKDESFWIVRFITDRFFFLLVGVGLVFSFGWNFLFDSSVEHAIVVACLVYLCSNGAQGIYFNMLNIIKCRKSFSLFATLDSVFKLVFIYLTLQFVESEVEYVLIALALSSLLVFLVVRWYVKSKFSRGLLSYASYMLLLKNSFVMTLPLYFPIFLVALKSVVDRWIIAAYVGIDELASFTVLAQLGYFPLIIIIGVIQTFVAPQVYALGAGRGGALGIELRMFIVKILFGITMLAIAACGVSIIFADQIFNLLVGEEYRLMSIYLPVFIICGAVASAGGVLHLAATSVFETSVLSRLLGVTVGVNVLLTFVLIIVWGFIGAIVALLFGGLATAILYWRSLSGSGFFRG